MVRYWLSKAFANAVYRTEGNKHLREVSLDCYRDEILEGVKSVLAGHGPHWQMEFQPGENGKASFTVMNTVFPTSKPVSFTCDTEWSDLLLTTGREAAMQIKGPQKTMTVYYGNAWEPDNQFGGNLRNRDDLETIANRVMDAYHDAYDAQAARNLHELLTSLPRKPG